YLPGLPKKRSQISHDDYSDKQGPKEISLMRNHTPDHEERKQSQIGKGATFTVTLPIQLPAPEIAAAPSQNNTEGLIG
ncbi:MAG: hypothetical protein Q7U34_02740, partial [Anaerolineales bacterium]|nr:hypothetical protein [Anaerolineales bacterium]